MEIMLTILFGVGLYAAIFAASRLHEEFTSEYPFIFLPLFFTGLGLLLFVPISFAISRWDVLLVGFFLNLTVSLLGHFATVEEIKKEADKWWRFGPLKQIKKRKGYVIDKSIQRNAASTRFGLTIIGVKHWWNQWFGEDGWTEEERESFLRHECGHTVFAIPIIFLETLVFYLFFENLTWTWAVLSLPFILFSVWTLVNWLDELLADAWTRGIFPDFVTCNEHPWWYKAFGGVGKFSHPPFWMRKIVMYLTRGFLKLIHAIRYAQGKSTDLPSDQHETKTHSHEDSSRSFPENRDEMSDEQHTIMKALDWAYDQALDTKIPGLDSAHKLAKEYLNRDGTLEQKVNQLIRWQNAKCATSGFITGLGGVLTLPIAIPANLSSVLFVQIRMIAAIAIMGGNDPHDDRVQTLAYVCLLGNSGNEVLKQAGVKIGTKMATNAIKKISFDIIKEINKKVGFRLLTKFGEKGAINLGKAVPLVGGVVGGTLDALATDAIGNAARRMFVAKNVRGELIGWIRKYI